MRNSNPSIMELIVFVCLIVVMAFRFFVKSPLMMNIVALIGLYLAIFNLYQEVYYKYSAYDRFLAVRGAFIIIFVLFASLIILYILCKASDLSLKWLSFPEWTADEITLATLLITLSCRVICYTIGRFIVGEKIYE